MLLDRTAMYMKKSLLYCKFAISKLVSLSLRALCR